MTALLTEASFLGLAPIDLRVVLPASALKRGSAIAAKIAHAPPGGSAPYGT